MRYSILFLLLGLSTAALAVLVGGAALALLWPSLDFALLGVAYARGTPSWLGKRKNGTLAAAPGFLFGPYIWLTWALLRAMRLLSRERAADEVAPGLWVGRRPHLNDLPSGARLVVDMTAELPVEAGIRRRMSFLCVPVLNGAAPTIDELASLIARLRDEDGVFLHCVAGYGRSATIAAALLIERRLASDIDDAEAKLRAKRPGIRLNAAQRDALQRWLDASQ